MSDTEIESTVAADKLRDEPAVGFVATTDNTDALIRSVVRAQQKGLTCLVTYPGVHPPVGALLAEELGATTLASETVQEEINSLKWVLVGAAKMRSSSGIILAPLSCSSIDFDRSRKSLESQDTFSVDAVPRAVREPQQTPETIVAIPAYNEEETIGGVIREAKAYAEKVLVIDDASTDDTVPIAEEAGAEVVQHKRNRGYGAAIKSAFAEASTYDTQALVTLDADGQHDPSDVPKLVAALDHQDTQLVIGSRFVDGTRSRLPFYRKFGIKVVNVLTNLSLGVVRSDSWVKDTQCGFRAYGRAAIESVAGDTTISDGMGASTDILYHAHHHNYGTAEVGTTVDYEVDNANNHNPFRHGLTLVKNIIKTVERQRPLTVLGIPGFANTLFGFSLVYWSVVAYNASETIPFSIVILGLFCSLLGLFLCFTAVILHSFVIYFSSEVTAPEFRD